MIIEDDNGNDISIREGQVRINGQDEADLQGNSMKASTYVRIEKLEATPDAIFPLAQMSEWVAGAEIPNLGKGLPVGYTVEGYLLEDVHVGRSVKMDRRKRNNIDMIGEFQTSDVVQIAGNIFTTRNSVYRMEEVEDGSDGDS